MLANPQTYFAELPDPKRQTRNKLHKLEDIVMITLCAVLCGFEDWVSIEDFGCEQEQWLRGFLELPHGIASHDTLSDVMGCIDRHVSFPAIRCHALPRFAHPCHSSQPF